jgi:hypothetical protein
VKPVSDASKISAVYCLCKKPVSGRKNPLSEDESSYVGSQLWLGWWMLKQLAAG